MPTHVEAFAELPHARRVPDAVQDRPRLGAELDRSGVRFDHRLRRDALFPAGISGLGQFAGSGSSRFLRFAFRNRILASVDLKLLLDFKKRS